MTFSTTLTHFMTQCAPKCPQMTTLNHILAFLALFGALLHGFLLVGETCVATFAATFEKLLIRPHHA